METFQKSNFPVFFEWELSRKYYHFSRFTRFLAISKNVPNFIREMYEMGTFHNRLNRRKVSELSGKFPLQAS